MNEVFAYVNELALFKNQWQLKTASATDYQRLVEEKFRPILKELGREVIREGWFESKAVYGYFACQSDGNDVDRVNEKTRLIAVVMPNDDSVRHDWARYRTSVKDVENLTGYTFFDRVPADIINPLKEKVDRTAIPAAAGRPPHRK